MLINKDRYKIKLLRVKIDRYKRNKTPLKSGKPFPNLVLEGGGGRYPI